MPIIYTTQAVAEKLGVSDRRVRQLVVELGIVPVQVIGKSQILSVADVRRLEARNTKRGRKAKK